MTISAFSQQNSALSVLKTAVGFARSSSKPDGNPTNPLLEALEKADPEKAKQLKEQQSEMQNILQQLHSAKTDLSEQRKETARQKIEQIKAQIAALRLQAAGDPRAVARQAARLARELASAAREYAQSGAGAAASGGVLGGGLAQAGNAANAASVGVAQNAPGVAAPVPFGRDISVTEDVQQVESQAGKAAQQDEQGFQSFGAGLPSGISDEDSKFAEEARRLLNQLKAIVKNAKDKLRLEERTDGKSDIAAAEKAFLDIEKSLSAITGGGAAGGAGPALNILA
ncbi:MAG TPA: hypothetical protein PLO23_07340 [Alphaproteobacteria bacterium]|nr:hypothetical protein [Alphaproteobacteria bacterium]